MLASFLPRTLGVFLPHGFCYQWDPQVVWLHVVSDVLIAGAYFAIPLGLFQLIRRRSDLEFSWMFGCFALFIIACGTTHLMEILTVWVPAYRTSGLVKAVTAAASVPTAILLLRVVLPAAVHLPSPSQLRRVNDALQQEVAARRKTEQELLTQAEALTRSNRDLQQFAYVASHDMREPLRMIAGYCDLLREECGDRLGSDATRYVHFAVDGARRMQTLIDALLAYSQVSAQALEFKQVQLEVVLSEVRHSLQRAIEEADATITHDPLPTATGDPTQLGQLLQNLVANALKFRGDAPARVHLSARTTPNEIVVSVRDHGIGIAPEYQQKIFQMFQRLHAPGTYPGTGIGLALCHRIVERHQGRIWVESQPGQGATFHVSLPHTHGYTADPAPDRHSAG